MTLTPKPLIFPAKDIQINVEELGNVDMKLAELRMHMFHSLLQIIVDEIKGRQECSFIEMMKHSAQIDEPIYIYIYNKLQE